MLAHRILPFEHDFVCMLSVCVEPPYTSQFPDKTWVCGHLAAPSSTAGNGPCYCFLAEPAIPYVPPPIGYHYPLSFIAAISIGQSYREEADTYYHRQDLQSFSGAWALIPSSSTDGDFSNLFAKAPGPWNLLMTVTALATYFIMMQKCGERRSVSRLVVGVNPRQAEGLCRWTYTMNPFSGLYILHWLPPALILLLNHGLHLKVFAWLAELRNMQKKHLIISLFSQIFKKSRVETIGAWDTGHNILKIPMRKDILCVVKYMSYINKYIGENALPTGIPAIQRLSYLLTLRFDPSLRYLS